MAVAEWAFVAFTLLTVLAGYLIAILVVAWRKWILEMDRFALSAPLSVDGFLLRTLRTTDYAFASLFPWAARRSFPQVDFAQIPRKLVRRFQLVASVYLLAMLGGLGMIAVAVGWL